MTPEERSVFDTGVIVGVCVGVLIVFLSMALAYYFL